MQFKTLLKTLTALFSLLSFSVVLASETTGVIELADAGKGPVILFQVIENQVRLDKSDIESASIDPFNGINIKLSFDAANRLKLLTQDGVDRLMNININGELISTSIVHAGLLGPNMRITGLTKKQADAFIQMFEASN